MKHNLSLLIFSLIINVAVVDRGLALPADVNLVDINTNKEAKINNTKDKELVVFWATWCSSCLTKLKETLPQIDKRSDVSVITVNIDKDVSRAKHYIKKHDITLPVLTDTSGDYIKKMKVVAAPHWAIYKRVSDAKGSSKSGNTWSLVASEEGFDIDKINKLLK